MQHNDVKGPAAGRQPTIWMNVTTSANWTRPPVGVVRVEQELRRELSALFGARFRTCIYENGTFVPEKKVKVVRKLDPIWPDPSFTDFPELTAFEPKGMQRSASPEVEEPVEEEPEGLFAFGDVLITLGLDWDQGGLPAALYDLKTRSGVKVICCCYDLIPILFPQFCVGDVSAYFKQYFISISWAASMMLCISKQTERDYLDLCRQLGLPDVPTVVIPLGNTVPEGGELVSEQVENLVREPYLLMVSTIERRKNHEVLYRAYHQLCREGHADKLPKLVFVGMQGWGVGDFIKDLELDPLTDGLIVRLNHVNDAELRLLYEKCMLVAFPSLYEGWGLPVAEALAVGKPVLASDRGSIPEVGGDLVDYVDPWNVTAWAKAILRAVEEPAWLKARAAQVRRDYVPRLWSQTAKVVHDAIAEMVARPLACIRIEPGYQMTTPSGAHFGARLISDRATELLSRGPGLALPKGHVSVEIAVDVREGEVGEGHFMLCHSNGRETIAKADVTLGKRQELGRIVRIEADLDRDVKDFELMTKIDPGLLISLNDVSIGLSGRKAIK